MLSVLQSVFWLLILLGVMILIHELGHFWAARIFGVRVDVFSFGFGPRLFGFKRGDTDYRFSAILFGGYVKMAGEQPGDENANDPASFQIKPRWQRLIIVFAGPAMNVVLAVALLTGLYMVKFQHEVEPGGAIVGHVTDGTPAAKSGVLPGDRIIQIDGQKNPTWEDIEREEIASAERRMDVTIERHGKLINTSVTPVNDERYGVASSGWEESGDIVVRDVTPGMPADGAGLKANDIMVAIDGQPIHSRFKLTEVIHDKNGNPVNLEYSRNGVNHTVTVKPVMSNANGKPQFLIGVLPALKLNVVTERLSLPAALAESLDQNRKNATLIVAFLRGILERRMSAKALDGPIGIARESSRAAAMGPSAFFSLMAIVSLNLAIVNLLPIPILDGSAILVLLIEMLRGRDLSTTFKEGLLKVGFVCLMAIVVFALYNDISKVFTQG